MKYKFEDIAINSTIKKKPEESDKYNYIGLEHLDPGNLFVQKYGSEVAPIGEKLVMKKGDVLFGKRRAYQKKVAIAPCDGIFSAHGMVLRPNENVVNKEYFPFFISSDKFLNEAIRISVGSLSPTINWRDLKELEFDLPPIKEQERLSKLLWSAYELKESYKKLIVATDEMVKTQFIEILNNCNYEELKLSDVADISTGSTPSRNHQEYWGNDFYWVSAQDMESKYIYDTKEKLTEKGADKCKILPKGSILYVCRGSIGVISINMVECATNQSICAAICKKGCINEYLYSYLKYNESEIKSLGSGTSFNSINQTTFSNIEIKLPSMDIQKEFVKIVLQADKSKAELQQSIENIDKVMKSLLP